MEISDKMLKALKLQFDGIKKTTAKVEEVLGELKERQGQLLAMLLAGTGQEGMFDKEWDRRVAIIHAVHKKDCLVTEKEFTKIVKKYGMKRQGANGFFVGKSPSFKRTGNGKIMLTEDGAWYIKDTLKKDGK